MQDERPLSDNPRAAHELQALLDEAISTGLPGISAAVATRDGLVWTGVAGAADLQAGTPVRPDLLFGIGSITKSLVAAVILLLAREGRLNLGTTVARLLGQAVERVPNGERAIVAQLLNHTSGIPSWEDDPAWIRAGRGDRLDVNRIWDSAATLSYIKGQAPLAAPGEQFSYANTNFTLLGLIIETLTGRAAMDEIRRRILAPLGLKDFYLEGFEPVPQSRLPRRYHWVTPEFRTTAGVNIAFPEARPGLIDASASNLSVEWTAGGMLATASDLALFGAALRDGRLLSSESMTTMTTWFPAGEGVQVGQGLFRYEAPAGRATIGHGGDVLGFSGSLFWVEGTDVVVSVLCNVGTMHSGQTRGAYSVAGTSRFIDAARRVALRPRDT